MRGLVDTGADATLVPSAQLQTIKAEEINRARLRSHWGEARLAIVYLVDLQIADHLLPGVEVIADDQSVEALLGRNALNRLTVLLDGPQEQADVLLQRSRRR
jgi:predicted aspartyl protease